MTLTNDQARWIVWGTKQARDQLHGATKWDEPGIAAAVAKVKHLHFVDVATAALRAADDRTLELPGAIGNPAAPCWAERRTDRPQPKSYNQGPICGYCDLPEHDVRAKHGTDHDWQPPRPAASDDAQPHRDRARAAVRAARGMGSA